MSLLIQSGGVRYQSVRLSVRLSGQNCFSDANGRIITNLAHSGSAGQVPSNSSNASTRLQIGVELFLSTRVLVNK